MPENNSPYSIQTMVNTLNQNFALIIIAVVILVGGFFGGSLWTENKLLKSGAGGSQPIAALQPVAPGAAGQPPAAPVGKQDVSLGHLPIKGKESAKVSVVAFEDFRCPFCKKFFDDTESQLIKEYVDTGKVKLAYRHYQFLGPASVVAGNASECANEQNKFWEFYDYMYKNQPSESDTSIFNTDKMTEIAGTLGMDTAKFKSCLSSTKYQKNVDQDFADGQKAGVSGTPTFYINGTQLVGAQPYSALKTIIDQELAK